MLRWWISSVLGSLLLPTLVSADLIRLRSGGELRGKLHPGHTRATEVTIETLTGATVVVHRDEIEFLTTRSTEIEEYETRTRRLPDTIEAHWELAEWCRDKRLTSQRDEQFNAVLRIDPEHEGAHKALGHVLENGEWMTRDEQMARRGYTRYRGRYVTQHELDLLQKSDAQRAAEQEWYSKVHPWVRWIAGNHDRQRRQGIANLEGITDPAAIPAMTTHMANHEMTAVRRLFVAVLAKMPGPQAVPPLVARSLYDGSADVREAALNALTPDQYEEALTHYLPALLNNDNAVVNRSAKALEHIGDPRVVPALIESLVTIHIVKVQVPDSDGISVGVNPSGPRGPGFLDPRSASRYLPPNIEMMLRTGQLPYGVIVHEPATAPKKMKTIRVPVELTNDSVLAALKHLTGRNFGYDERTWKLWWASQGSLGGRALSSS